MPCLGFLRFIGDSVIPSWMLGLIEPKKTKKTEEINSYLVQLKISVNKFPPHLILQMNETPTYIDNINWGIAHRTQQKQVYRRFNNCCKLG